MDQRLRDAKAQLLAPLATQLQGVRPLTLTAIGLLVGLGAALAAALENTSLALALWLGNRLLDGLDGEVARLSGRQRDLGGYLDMLADLLVYSLLPVALTIGHPSSASHLALALLLASFYLNVGSWMYLAALLEKRGRSGGRTSIVMPSGLIEGGETMVFYALMLLAPTWLPWLFGVMAFLVAVTTLQRIIWAMRHLDALEEGAA
jgi:phosphatidylglycerophosphate synthase